MGEREDAGGAASRGGRRGTAGRVPRFRGTGRFRYGSWSRLGGDRVDGGAGIGLFLDAHQILIGNFPAEMLVLAALLEILFEEDGAAGIGDEDARSGQKDIAGAVLHLYTTPQKGGETSHTVRSVSAR